MNLQICLFWDTCFCTISRSNPVFFPITCQYSLFNRCPDNTKYGERIRIKPDTGDRSTLTALRSLDFDFFLFHRFRILR